MFRHFSVIAALVALANAASWPMITVNTAGDLVLNSPTKAASFQLTAKTLSAGPVTSTSVTAATRDTVTVLDTDTDTFIVSVPSSPATSAGYKLPAATEGRTIKLFNSGSAKGAFTLWTASTSVFIDGTTATSIDIASTTSYIVATATSSTNWVISRNSVNGGVAGAKSFVNVPSAATTTVHTLTAAETFGGYFTVTPTASFALTVPSAATLTAADINSANGDAYEFTVRNTHTQSASSAASIVTLTADTSATVTVPSDGSQLIYPGHSRTYLVYRTSATAWTFVLKSSVQSFPTTAITATLAGTTTAATASVEATHFVTSSITWNAGADTLAITNSYAKVGDIVTMTAVTTAVADAQLIGAGQGCVIPVDGTIKCYFTGAAAAATFSFKLYKA